MTYIKIANFIFFIYCSWFIGTKKIVFAIYEYMWIMFQILSINYIAFNTKTLRTLTFLTVASLYCFHILLFQYP